jgi:HD-GYP domain-containing protein (c-di-GMP phosphodiesterase class II)
MPPPYRRAMDHEAAVAELVRAAGTQFDPRVVATLPGRRAGAVSAPAS